LNDYDIKLSQGKVDAPEIQGKNISKVAEFSVKFAAERLSKTVIKIDVDLESTLARTIEK